MLTILILIPIIGIAILSFYNLSTETSRSFFSLEKEEKNPLSLENALPLSINTSINTSIINKGYDLRVRQITLFTSIIAFIFSTVI
jgi:hypothetical protein